MEVTARRAVAMTLAAYALLLMAWPPRPTGLSIRPASTPLERLREARTAANDTLSVVEYAIWSRQLRETVRRQLAAAPASEWNRAIIDVRIPVAAREHIQAVYTATRARMSGGRVALPLVIVLDTAESYRLGTTLWIEDTTSATPSCATVVRVRVSGKALDKPLRLAREVHRVIPAYFPQPKHFGLCGFEAAFGAPSIQVRRWLQEREYRPVASGYDPATEVGSPRPISDFAVPYYNSANNAAQGLQIRTCVAGRMTWCLDAVAPPGARSVSDIDEIPSDWRRWRGWGWYGADDVMNAMASSMGAESFAQLWRDDAAPPDAYQRLSGVPIDTLARRVLVGNVPPVHFGASLSPSITFATLLIAALFAGLAALSHPRHRR